MLNIEFMNSCLFILAVKFQSIKMNRLFLSILFLSVFVNVVAQEDLPTDYLSKEFHKERRQALRDKMPENSVAVFFANAVRNRSSDVEYLYHQDPNFYYLTGYKEPHAVLVIFSENQNDENGNTFNEQLYVQERNAHAEMWTGRRLGVGGVIEQLGFEMAFNGKEFLNAEIDFMKFDKVMFDEFHDDYRDSERNKADLFDLVSSFKTQVGYYVTPSESVNEDDKILDKNRKGIILEQRAQIDNNTLKNLMAGMREIKTPDELKLLTKAIRMSAIGQIEVMRAMKPNMSEKEIQGIHEYVYRKYDSEDEGYPGVVGGGYNGCILHYLENSKSNVEGDLVLMDLGAEYHGYTADVTRTIPSSGKFTSEQKAIYQIVLDAQNAGISAALVGADRYATHNAAKPVINKGLFELGIIKSVDERHSYFPHGTSHHIGLDVHDPSTLGNLKANMVITVEPGIYIPEGSDCDEKWWGIAVRIEDDILITEYGPINLSGEAPRKVVEIEAMMARPSPLDSFKLPKLD